MPTAANFRGRKNVNITQGASLLLLTLGSVNAYGASQEYCRPFAAHTSQLFLTYAWTRAYTYCLNQDNDPIRPETAEGAVQIVVPNATPIVVPRPERVGDVPATDPKDEALKIVHAPPKPKATGGQAQALCTSHGKRTVYSGLHWRCVK
jgi:hypothetical protein